MKIRLITARVMVGISAVILILSVINWVRSSLLHETDDLVYVGASGGYALTSADGVVALGKSSGWGSRPGWFYRHDNAGGAFWDWWRYNPSAGGNDLQLLGTGVFYTHNGSRFFGSIQMPYWLIVLAASISPAIGLHRRRNPTLRPSKSCAKCGFDLRASPTRCPECGTPVGKADVGGRP